MTCARIEMYIGEAIGHGCGSVLDIVTCSGWPGGVLMAQHRQRLALDTVDPIWSRIRHEAEDIVRREPEIASFIYAAVLHHETLEAAIVHRLAQRLDHVEVSGELIRQAYMAALEDEPSIGEAFRADIVAVVDRDPA